MDLDEVRHRICFIHLKGAAEDANRIRTDWYAAADRRIPPEFFGRGRDAKQQRQVLIPRRQQRLS